MVWLDVLSRVQKFALLWWLINMHGSAVSNGQGPGGCFFQEVGRPSALWGFRTKSWNPYICCLWYKLMINWSFLWTYHLSQYFVVILHDCSGDNFFKSATYTIEAICAKSYEDTTEKLKEIEAQILRKRNELRQFETEYRKVLTLHWLDIWNFFSWYVCLKVNFLLSRHLHAFKKLQTDTVRKNNLYAFFSQSDTS